MLNKGQNVDMTTQHTPFQSPAYAPFAPTEANMGWRAETEAPATDQLAVGDLVHPAGVADDGTYDMTILEFRRAKAYCQGVGGIGAPGAFYEASTSNLVRSHHTGEV